MYLVSAFLIVACSALERLLEIICADSSRVILLAWPLATQEGSSGPHSIRLPSRIQQMSAYRNQVGIVTASNEVLIWQIGGELKSVVISRLPIELDDFITKPLAVAFHPDNEESHFVVHIASSRVPLANNEWRTSIVVQQCREGTPDAFYIFYLVSSEPDAKFFRHRFITLEDGHIGIMMTDEVFYIPETTKEHAVRPLPSPHPCKHQWINPSEGGNDTLGLLLVVKFDTRRNMFSTGSYHLPDKPHQHLSTIFRNHVNLDQPHIWRDQALLPVYTIDSSIRNSAPSVNQIIAMGINNCSEIQKPSLIPWYGRLGPEDTQIFRTWDDSRLGDCGTAFCWIGGMGFAEDARKTLYTSHTRLQQSDNTRMMRGDDDFVVLFGGAGYVVWCFDKDMSLPVTASPLDPALQSYPLPPGPLHPLHRGYFRA